MKSKFLILTLILLLVVPLVSGATIHGSIYDKNLNTIKGAIVEVNSSPIQRHISKYGGYSFELENGNYTFSIYVNKNGRNILVGDEKIIVKSNGDFVVDLFSERDLGFLGLSQKLIYVIVGLSLLLLTSMFVIIFLLKPKKKVKSEDVIHETGDDVIKKRVLKIVVEGNNKVTQKDIRKKVSLSEAKVSQIITDLERDGKIKKVRKGRINVIILS